MWSPILEIIQACSSKIKDSYIKYIYYHFLESFTLCLVVGNFEGKYERKKIERKSRKKEKKKNEEKKIDSKSINYFYIFL